MSSDDSDYLTDSDDGEFFVSSFNPIILTSIEYKTLVECLNNDSIILDVLKECLDTFTKGSGSNSENNKHLDIYVFIRIVNCLRSGVESGKIGGVERRLEQRDS